MSQLALRTKIKLGITAALVFVGLIAFFAMCRIVTVDGNERVVWQQWSGVNETAGADGTHIYFGLTTTPHKYFIGTDTFVVDDKTLNADNDFMDEDERRFNQPDAAPISIPVQMDYLSAEDLAAGKTTGPTSVKVSCTMQYHLDPSLVVQLHNTKTRAYRTSFIRPVVTKILNDLITPLDARTVYQGTGRIKLQADIENTLMSHLDFKANGIVVERFVLNEVEFVDLEFLGKIQREALAEQARKTAMKEMVAHEAEAKSAEAEARSEQNRRLVEAETKKGEQIASAEADKAKRVLAAEAQREEARLEGEGIKLKKIAEADGVLALGIATAEAKRLQLEAYQGEGGRRFAEVEKARALGEGIQKIYWLPSDMTINAIASDFQNAITVALPNN